MSTFNAWKLTRVEQREKPRTDWPERWASAGASVQWNGALSSPMVALKDSPIWRALGSGVGGFTDATGNDSPPFAFGSGMGWIGVNFEEEQLKVKQAMNQPNKVNLFLLIAQKFTDEMCAKVLERFNNHPRIIANKLANETFVASARGIDWDESKHPRAADGKFASAPGAGAPDRYDDDPSRSQDDLSEDRKLFEEWTKDVPREKWSKDMLAEYERLGGNDSTPTRPKKPYGEKKLRQSLDQIDEDRQYELDEKWAKSGLLERLLHDPESPKTNHYGEHEDISTNHVDRIPKGSRRRFYGYKDTQKIREYLEEAKKLKVKKGEGQTPREILLEKLKMIEEGQGNDYSDGSKYPGWYHKPGLNGNYDANEALYEQLEIVRKLGKVKEIETEEKKKAKSRDLNHKRYARLNDVEDEITRMVEAYGTDGLTGKVKKDGTSADEKTRKAYKALQREQKKLERQIDWQALDDEPDVDDSTRSLEDDNYRSDDPPSRTPEAADEADREMFREWTKTIPREKWTKDMQAEYKRLFGGGK